jgi:hypothetical protein
MKVSIKTLKGSSFEIEVEPTTKVRHRTHLIRAAPYESARFRGGSSSGSRVVWLGSRMGAC